MIDQLKKWALPVIFIIAIAVRFWGINFGLPQTECRPDETAIVSRAVGFFTGDFNPHFFIYPTLYMYLLFGCYLVYYVIGQLSGIYSSPDDLMREFALNPSNLYLIDRCLSATFSVATLLVVYVIAQKLFNRKAATFAALFLSLAHITVRDAHFGVTDSTQTFWVVLAVLFMLRSYESRSIQDYTYTGLFSGLAISTKYTAIPIIFSMAIAHILKIWAVRDQWKDLVVTHRRLIRFTQIALILIGVLLWVGTMLLSPEFINQYLSPDGHLDNPERIPAIQRLLRFCGSFFLAIAILSYFRGISALINPSILRYLGGLLLGFFLGTPYALLDPKAFTAAFSSVIHASAHVTHGEYLGRGFTYHFFSTLPLGLGSILFGLALLGIIVVFRLGIVRAIVFLSFPSLYYLLMGQSTVVPFRYMLLVVPFACITAAIALTQAITTFSQLSKRPRFEPFLALFLATLILVQPAIAIAQSDRLLSIPDNRLIAANWIRQNIAPESSFYQTGLLYGQVIIDRSPNLVMQHLQSKQINGQKLTETQLHAEDHIETYPQWLYDPDVGFFHHQRFQKGLPDYIIIQESCVERSNRIEPGIAELVQKSYKLKKSFRAIETQDRRNRFDLHDSFYLPFAGFSNISRPGTNLYLYEHLKDEHLTDRPTPPTRKTAP
jgi:4-amino-4-deoxy-L-arabinose transferase-like glycosyltransferase